MRIGIDLGGTKIEGIILDDAGQERERLRVPTPPGAYEEAVRARPTRRAGTVQASGRAHPIEAPEHHPNAVQRLTGREQRSSADQWRMGWDSNPR